MYYRIGQLASQETVRACVVRVKIENTTIECRMFRRLCLSRRKEETIVCYELPLVCVCVCGAVCVVIWVIIIFRVQFQCIHTYIYMYIYSMHGSTYADVKRTYYNARCNTYENAPHVGPIRRGKINFFWAS